MPNLTVTGGIRIEHNSNPICHTNCFARLQATLTTISGDTTVPLQSR